MDTSLSSSGLQNLQQPCTGSIIFSPVCLSEGICLSFATTSCRQNFFPTKYSHDPQWIRSGVSIYSETFVPSPCGEVFPPIPDLARDSDTTFSLIDRTDSKQLRWLVSGS